MWIIIYLERKSYFDYLFTSRELKISYKTTIKNNIRAEEFSHKIIILWLNLYFFRYFYIF